jgi:hypothetical protein
MVGPVTAFGRDNSDLLQCMDAAAARK